MVSLKQIFLVIEGKKVNDKINKDFVTYNYLENSSKEEKYSAWQIGIGLQAVDGLKPSKYLYEIANKHINEEINEAKVKECIAEYYNIKEHKKETFKSFEADMASANISTLLLEKTFSFTPISIINIHKRIFENIYEHAGIIRPYNITKKEWVLNGETVLYTPTSEIIATLDYEFEKEKKYRYNYPFSEEDIKHIASFISSIWQIHPFMEGNTRVTATFFIKYMRYFGVDLNNEPFLNNSWYFRNSLVRANYMNYKLGIHENTEFLEKFLQNILIGTNYTLKNRDLHIFSKQENNNNENIKNISTLKIQNKKEKIKE